MIFRKILNWEALPWKWNFLNIFWISKNQWETSNLNLIRNHNQQLNLKLFKFDKTNNNKYNKLLSDESSSKSLIKIDEEETLQISASTNLKSLFISDW